MHETMKLALIYGSVREGRFSDTIAGWVRQELRTRTDYAVDVIDPLEPDLPVPQKRADPAGLTALRERIGAADAFIVVTPEYNHAYPGALKMLIDAANREWYAKPVAFVSYGGISGGLRAVEQLRLVFAELHAATIRDSVSFANARTKFDAAGNLREPEAAQEAMAVMLDRLNWWATALRNARRATPYVKGYA